MIISLKYIFFIVLIINNYKRVQIYCTDGRIKGALKWGEIWLIPKNAQKPEEKERRMKSI